MTTEGQQHEERDQYLRKITPFLNKQVRAKGRTTLPWRYIFIVTSVWADEDGYYFVPRARILWRYINNDDLMWQAATVGLNGYKLEGFNG